MADKQPEGGRIYNSTSRERTNLVIPDNIQQGYNKTPVLNNHRSRAHNKSLSTINFGTDSKMKSGDERLSSASMLKNQLSKTEQFQ